MRCLGRMVGCLLLVLVVNIAPVSIWTVLMWGELSNADAYTESLSDDAYQEMTLLVLPAIAQAASGAATDGGEEEIAVSLNIFTQMIINLNFDVWRSIFGGLLDPNWVKETLNDNLSSIFTYWRFENDEINIQADLEPVAIALDGENGAAIAEGVFAATRDMEDCDASQLNEVDQILTGFDTSPGTTEADTAFLLPACNPGDEYMGQLEEHFETARFRLLSEMETLPDYQFDLREQSTDTPEEVEQFDQGFFELRRALFVIDETVVVLLLFPVMLMSLVVVVTVRSAKGFFLWMGVALISIAAVTLFPLIPYIYNLILNPQRPALAGNTSTSSVLGFEVVSLLVSSFAPSVLVATGVMLFIGVGFIVLAALLKAPQRRAQQPVYYVVPQNAVPVSGATPMPPMMQVGTQQMTPTMQPPVPTPPPQQPTPPPAPSSQELKRSTSSQPMSSTAAEKHRAALERNDLPDDRTFIPTETDSRDVPTDLDNE